LATPQQPPKVRLDKSRTFSTVHGDRPAGDPHANVSYYQDGLPYGGDEVLVSDHPEVQADPKKKELAERLLKRATKQAKNKVSTMANSGGPVSVATEEGGVNLSAWARGEQDVVWQELVNAISARFSVRVGGKHAALELLLEEQVVTFDDLSVEHKSIIEPD
jgi:hypothetical protein